jgi:hypothetical protein
VNVVVIVLVVIAVVASVIVRQLKGEALRGKRVVLLPAVLLAVGAWNLAGTKHLNVADIALIATSAVIATGIGVAQGMAMRLESRNGGLWGQLPVRGLWLWGGLVVSRVVMMVVAVPLSAHAVSSTDSILLVLGINRLAQAALIVARALASGIPFAPEKDGKTFLSGLLGDATTRPTAPGTRTATESASLTGVNLAGLARGVSERLDARS